MSSACSCLILMPFAVCRADSLAAPSKRLSHYVEKRFTQLESRCPGAANGAIYGAVACNPRNAEGEPADPYQPGGVNLGNLLRKGVKRDFR